MRRKKTHKSGDPILRISAYYLCGYVNSHTDYHLLHANRQLEHFIH